MRLVVPLALVVLFLRETLAVLFAIYVLSGPVELAIARRRKAATRLTAEPKADKHTLTPDT